MWSDGGSESKGITFFKPVQPTDDYSLSVQVYSNTSESCGIFVRSNLTARCMEGFNFEFGHYGADVFLLARNFGGGWVATEVASGAAHEWYTMQLNVSQAPFTLTASVIDSSGVCRGTLTTNEIDSFGFSDIKYVRVGVWGYSPSSYTFRDMQGLWNPQEATAIDGQVFDFESNSTVSATAFDAKTATLSFTVSGPTNSTGYVKVTVAKTVLPIGEELQVFLDGEPLAYTVTSEGTNWVYVFHYHHSIHRISMQILQTASQPENQNISAIAALSVAGAIAAALGITPCLRRRSRISTD